MQYIEDALRAPKIVPLNVFHLKGNEAMSLKSQDIAREINSVEAIVQPCRKVYFGARP